MIRIFIGTEEMQWLAAEVLKFSILRRTKAEVEFHELKDMNTGLQLKTYTGFSFNRWFIPETCHFEGKAIYLDADIVVLDDIEKFYNLPMNGNAVLCRPQPQHKSYFTSVMLLDCSKLKHWDVHEWVVLINTGFLDYNHIMFMVDDTPPYVDFTPMPDAWNHLDKFDENTKILHYTSVPHQPWKVFGHPAGHVFRRELKAALADGFIKRADVEREIAAKHVYAQLLEDTDKTE